jgi:hypothetical protein
MAEPLPEPVPPRTFVDPAGHEAEIARKNIVWAWSLLGLFCVLFGGTVLVALVYLWLS